MKIKGSYLCCDKEPCSFSRKNVEHLLDLVPHEIIWWREDPKIPIKVYHSSFHYEETTHSQQIPKTWIKATF